MRFGILATLLSVADPCWAASLIGTSTTPDAFHSGSRFYAHCANGHYWVGYHDGVEPVLASSPDGVTWTARGPIFSSFDPTPDGRWAIRYSGNNIIALGFNATDNDRYYRNGVLNSDGTITWNAADASVGLVTATWPQLNAVIANGKPALWRGSAANTAEGALRLGDQLNTPTWVAATAPPEITPTTGGGFSAGAIFPIGGADPEDLIILRATTVTPPAAASHRLVAVKYDASLNTWDPPTAWYNVSLIGPAGGPFGLTEGPDTEVKDIADGGAHQRFAAVRDSNGNLHAVYVNRNDDVVHYRKDVGFNDTWSRVSADVTEAPQAIDSVALTAGRNGQVYLFYLRTGGYIPFHYRRFNGTSWESENRGSTNSGTVRGFGAMESTNGCTVGIAWAEGAGPYNIMFTLINDCPPLQTSEGAGTVTVTAPESFEMRFNEATGGGVDTFFDLADDPTRTYDLAAGIDSHETLFIDEVASGGINYRTDQNTNGARAQLLEATPTRVRIRQEAFFQRPNNADILTGIKGYGDYSVYGSGKMALAWNRKATSDVSYTGQELQHVVHYQSVAPLSTWAPFSDSGPLAPTGPGPSDFTLAVSASGSVRTDFLHILYADWAAAVQTRWSADGVNEYGSASWEKSAGTILAGSSETWNFLTYFKPTIFSDNLSLNVTRRRDDYRSPDSLSIMVGGPWNDPSENTAADHFNEAEGVYNLTLDPALGLRFDINGGGTTRHKPFFKIRQWRSLQDPSSVTLEGFPLDNDLDYRADVKPISRAHFANVLRYYSTLQDAAAVTSPNVGAAGTVGGTTDFPGARFGSGARFDVDGEYLSIPPPSFSEDVIEFWYRPFYDYGSGVAGDPQGLFGSWVDASNFFLAYHQPGTTAADGIRFEISVAGVPFSTAVGAPPAAPVHWRANEWVHLRFVWDAAPDRLQVYLNGTLVSAAPSGSYPTPFSSPDFYVGDRELSGSFNNNANGIIDELYVHDTTDQPTLIAYGGLTTNVDEFLASAANNFVLGFTVVDPLQRGEYLYLGVDSKFRGLNVALATAGAGTSPNLQWQFWNGNAWTDLEVGFGFTDETANLTQPNGTVYWTGDPLGWSPYSVNGGPELYYVRAYLAAGDYATSYPREALIKTDILLFQHCGDITANSQTFEFPPPTPTAVELVSFEARGLNAAVELSWRTASELDNLGFHIYRSASERGPYERITAAPIPGLGSSPAGARYGYVDRGLTNGVQYFYQLEDIETTGKTKRHGPVEATPSAEAPTSSSPPAPSASGPRTAEITYGDPSAVSLRVLRPGRHEVLLVLATGGFYAEPRPDGTVRLRIPDFVEASEPGSPALPVKRAWVEAVAGRRVRVVSVRAEDVEMFSMRPSPVEAPAVIATLRGTVRAGRQSQPEGKAFRRGLYPEEAARLLSVGFQGEVKKALVELSPLRWDGEKGQLLLARRLTVRLMFSGREASEQEAAGARGRRHREGRSHERRRVTARLTVREKGLYGVRFEEVMGASRRGVAASSLRLSRQGEAVAFHIEPDQGAFRPGSVLYFLSEGASLNPYGPEAVYELEQGGGGVMMPTGSVYPSGPPVHFLWADRQQEENRYYQAALVAAEDLWLWDLLFAPVTKSYPFGLPDLVRVAEPSKLELRLQGASDFPSSPDHHLRVWVNGTPLAESFFEGKQPLMVTAEIPPGVLKGGENELSIENVGDTGAAYSMVMVDRFRLRYPRALAAEAGGLRGTFSESGVAEVGGLGEGASLLDISENPPRWLWGVMSTAGGLRFAVEAGRSYLAVSPPAVLKPRVEKPLSSRLKEEQNRADYLVIAPRALLDAAAPLLDLRRSQGLSSRAVSMEEVYSEFGFGETRPEAVREFLSYAYHHWRRPSPRYVLLLGDASYDFKDYLGTGMVNQVPPLMVKTSYLWTASDPAYGSVNGEDLLPDLAIGRLPAASLSEARVMVEKILAYEAGAASSEGAVVLVADNADRAGDFEADADELASGLLASREPRRIYLGRLGVERTREAIVDAFDQGASLMSYLGHGGIHLWAQENIFDTQRVGSLAPRPRQPLVLTLNCLNGYFHFPYFNSLGEELVKAEGKGAIAAFSPSGLSLNEPAHRFHTALVAELVGGRHARLGDAVLASQAVYAQSGALPELLRIYHLLGDPALRIR
jgi:hypothetical protein